MKILVLGGTKFLGRHLVKLALEAGHDLTVFNRGKHAPELFDQEPGVHQLIGDRASDLSALRPGEWDVVYDLSGYQPQEVRATVELLSPRIGLYVFVSTISVYSGGTSGSVDEGAEVYGDGDGYGPLKALCEREVLKLSGPVQGLVVRPGLIVGPYDPTFRFNYWLERVARGGAILAPGRPGRRIQVIDVCDLAKFMLRLSRPLSDLGPSDTALPGEACAVRINDNIFNTAGPGDLSMEALLMAIETVVRARRGQKPEAQVRFVWVKDQELLSRSISEWTELPLWIAEEGASASFYAINSNKAVSCGLTYRPIRSTIEAIYDHHPQLLSTSGKTGPLGELPHQVETLSASLEKAILSAVGGSY